MNQPAFEHNNQPVARQLFYAIACDPSRSVAVEACAGAGKTWMLVSRMVRALLDGAEPHEILAITFTKKAAGEMRQRLQQWLLQFAGQSDTELRQELLSRGYLQDPTAQQIARLRQLHQTLLLAGRPVQIRTFHSWFAALLRSAPLQALADLGLPAHYELLENDALAVAQVWLRFQDRVASDAAARDDYGASVAVFGRHQTQKSLEAALSKRVEFALADRHGVVDTSVLGFAQQFPVFAGVDTPYAWLMTPPAARRLREAASVLGAATQTTCTDAARDLEQALTQADPSGVLAALLTKSGTPRKFSDKVTGIATVRAAQASVLQVVGAQAQHQAWLHQQRMARLTRLLTQEYAQLKRERGWIDMGDLERSALALMSDPVLSGWVQERLDARVRHLLIDEFQDTNPLQWQALNAWLSSYAGAGQAPSVFLVGDPKQSIYRFRRAEPQVFKAAQRFVVQGIGGDLLSCDHTRRNAPVITSLVNQVMGQAQQAGEFEGMRAHSTESLAPGSIWRLPRTDRERAAPVADAAPSHWRDSLTTPRQVAEETLKTMECRQAAQWLAQQLQTSALLPRDVMVLARKRERLGLMQAELACLHIAAEQPEKNELAEMPEVQDLLGLLDVLVSPQHDVSLARALKSPVFGISDADLVQLVLAKRTLEAAIAQTTGDDAPAQGGKLSWLQVLQQAPDLPAALAPLGAQLGVWKTWVDTLPPHDALCAIYHHGDVLARYGAATPATQRERVLAHLRALLSAALQVDGGRYTTAYALVRALRAGGVHAPVRSDGDAVRLLTIHGAKGLEAPLVLLLDTDSEPIKAQTMGVLVDWPGEAAHPQRFVFLASESKPPPCVADALAVEQAARRREELNALYVALTRAQRTLVLSSVEPHTANESSWWQRLHDLAQDAPALPVADAQAPAVCESAPAFTLLCVPKLPFVGAGRPQAAINTIAPAVSAQPASAADDLDARIGQAMHALLEHYAPQQRPAHAGALVSPGLQTRIAQTFVLEPQQMASAHHMARAIVQGEGAWAWDADQLAWQGNEVALVHSGRMLRIDRLVLRRGAPGAKGQWWVLDYKSTSQPQLQPELCEQLLSYRAAVSQAQAGQTVRAAFLTAQGALIELQVA